MGHSLGAFISMAFAARYSERCEKLILMDGGGQLNQDQWDQVAFAIKPSLERLGQVFPSFDAYVENMKKASFMQPWVPALEAYFRYEIEEVKNGVCSKINPAHIGEEVRNLRQEEPARYYPQVTCPVLILRATDGILSTNDIVLPETAAERMISEIPNARLLDINGANHFSILFQPYEARDQAIREFLKE
jgi:pimeloyl-ACP methyl ester carboxylesterase